MVEHLHHDRAPTQSLGPRITSRASFVEPLNFRGQTYWLVDLTPSNGPNCLGVFGTREEALKAEEEWLYNKLRSNDPSHAMAPASGHG